MGEAFLFEWCGDSGKIGQAANGPHPTFSREDSMKARIALPLGFLASIAVTSAGVPGATAPGQDPSQVRAPASGRPLAIEDYYRIQTISDPRISPDGAWVSFVLSTRIEEDNSTRSETYLVPTDASAGPRRVLHYGRDISDARWTADSRLQYTTDGVWSLDPARPAARPMPATALPARAVPSPDGTWIAQVSERPQPKRRPSHSSEFERRHEERFRGVQFDWKDFQRDGAPFPAPDPTDRPAADIAITPGGGGEAKQLTNMDLRPEGLAWHPGGKTILFRADREWRNELRYENSELWTVTVTGELKQLTDDGYIYSDAAFSPDGRSISCIRRHGTDMVIEQKLNHGGPADLLLFPAEGGNPVNLTEKWDLEPRDPQWSPDGRHIYFTAGIGGSVHLFRVPAAGGAVEQITEGERRLGSLSIDRAFRRISYTVSLIDAPADL
ncbi:MAG: hypothetical protein FJW35_18360, partial [Acidobacteria bacterium]|nr:hypothetical protein [Acidobacteriota bacterium]